MLTSRTLRIALLLSIGVHVVGMSIVTIITPTGLDRIKPFTTVVFLGPILTKTAFDVMIENANPVFSTNYGDVFERVTNAYLKVVTPKRKFSGELYPGYFDIMAGSGVLDFLSGTKSIPDFLLSPSVIRKARLNGDSLKNADKKLSSREVVHKPKQPLILRGLYGNESGYRIKLRVLANRDGNVKFVEPLTTTGYPQLDFKAAEYVKTWIFAPEGEGSSTDGWVEVEIFLKMEEE